jgi:hypothetical protein
LERIWRPEHSFAWRKRSSKFHQAGASCKRDCERRCPDRPRKRPQQPLSDILRKPIGIDGFNPNLKELSSSKRGDVLQQLGSERIYRYRFRNPSMQPYVIMKGIQDGFLDEKAKLALSAPEEADLFSNDS